MDRARGHANGPVEPAPRPEVVVTFARRIAEVYRNADDDLRHAVHDSLLAGLPQSVLADDLDEPGADLEQKPGAVVPAAP
jgi:hypothetical protein